MGFRRRSRAGFAVSLLAVITAATITGCTDEPQELRTATYELPAFNFTPVGQRGDQSNSYKYDIPRPPGNIMVKRITWKLLDGAGNEIPPTNHDIHLHHVVLFNDAHPDHACPSWRSGLGGRWAAPGGERTPFELPSGFGYYSGTSDNWSASWHVMNLTNQPQRNIRVQYTVTWATELSNIARVTPYWLDQAGCGGSGTFEVPGGGDPAVFSRTRTYTLPRSGVIRAVRSHMHDGGIDLTLTKADGTPICTREPIYHQPETGGGHDHGAPGDDHGHGAGAPRIIAIPLCRDPNVRIASGERLEQTVRYRNDEHLPDAMGSNLVWIAEDPLTTPTTQPTTTVGAR